MNQFDNSPFAFPGTQPAEGFPESKLSSAAAPVRLAFLRKVYGILATQLAVTSIVSAIMMALWQPHLQQILAENSWLLILNALATLGVTLALALWKEGRQSYPTNFILLAVFTALNSISVGVFVSMYDTQLVVVAFCITTLVVVALSLYTLTQTTRDFSSSGGMLFSLLMACTIGGFANIWLRSSFIEMALCIGGAFLFSCYIVYDTDQIMRRVSAEEYVIAVITLYLDIINLFLKVVKILDAIKRSQENQKREKKK